MADLDPQLSTPITGGNTQAASSSWANAMQEGLIAVNADAEMALFIGFMGGQ